MNVYCRHIFLLGKDVHVIFCRKRILVEGRVKSGLSLRDYMVKCASCGEDIPNGQEVMKGLLKKKSYHKECASKLKRPFNIETYKYDGKSYDPSRSRIDMDD